MEFLQAKNGRYRVVRHYDANATVYPMEEGGSSISGIPSGIPHRFPIGVTVSPHLELVTRAPVVSSITYIILLKGLN